MIEIIQAGQFGKTKSLIEMHKVRKLIFKDRMGWDVDISDDGLEVDEFDLPETIYILVRDAQGRVAGVWRMLPSSSPSMIREIWPDFLENFPMNIDERIWEISRFGVHTYSDNTREQIKSANQVTAKLIIALLKVCEFAGIEHIYTMYNKQIARSVKKIGFYAEEVSKEIPIDGVPSLVGKIRTDRAALKRVQDITGLDVELNLGDLPPIFHKMNKSISKELQHA